MKAVRKFIGLINFSTIIFAMVCLVAMSIITIANVVLRYFFSTALMWGEEITLVLVIWFTFIALAMGVKFNLHISISILPQDLPAWLETTLVKIKRVVTLIIGGIFLYYGIILVGFTSRSILPATGLPSAIMYLPMPVCSVLIIYESILVLFNIKSDNDEVISMLGGEELL